MNIQNAFDGKTAKVGDKVWSMHTEGWETIRAVLDSPGAVYPITTATNDGECHTYTIDGRFLHHGKTPSLFYGPPDIIGPPKPKRMVKKLMHRWVNVYPMDRPDMMHLTKEDADRRADLSTRIACVEINQEYAVPE